MVKNWDEVRTAWHVARLGTVSGAAEAMGVHHATVIRHIDALERQLGSKLFQRHARGYTPTEAGRDLLKVAESIADQFGQLAGRIRGQGAEVSGELVVTSIPGLTGVVVPALCSFRDQHPQLKVRYLTDTRLFRLEYGEAHVAIRAGAVPENPDNVVQAFGGLSASLYATKHYAERYGIPKGPEDFAAHRFVGVEGDNLRAPFHRWLHANIPLEQLVFRGTETAATVEAIRAGTGIGFVPDHQAIDYPELVQVMPAQRGWAAPLWLVTHVDLHRTPKVQAFLSHLKAAAKDWHGVGPNVLID